MSSIDTSGLDTGKPSSGSATTQSVRDNFSNIYDNFAIVKTELEDGSGVTDAAAWRGAIGLDTDDSVTFGSADIGDPGTETSGVNVGGTTYTKTFRVNDIGGSNPAQFVIHRHSTTWPSVSLGTRSNSDTNSHGTVTAGMVLWTQYAAGWTGTEYNLFGAVDFSVDTTGTINDTSAPGRIRFMVTADGSVAPTTAVTITNDKAVAFAGAVTIATTLAVTGNTTLSGTLNAIAMADILGYDIAGGAVGTPDASTDITTVVAVRSFTFPSNLSGSKGDIGTNPSTASIALAVKRNGTQFATITISTAGAFTFVTTSTPTFVAGDVLTVTTPASLDSAADIYYTLKGSLA